MKRENKRIRIHFTTFFTPEQMMAASKLLCAIAVGLQLMPYVFSIDTEASEYTVFVTLINLLLFIIPFMIFGNTLNNAFIRRMKKRGDRATDITDTEEYQSGIRNIGEAICSTVMPAMLSIIKKGIDSRTAIFLAISFLFFSVIQFVKIKEKNIMLCFLLVSITETIFLVYIIIVWSFLY